MCHNETSHPNPTATITKRSQFIALPVNEGLLGAITPRVRNCGPIMATAVGHVKGPRSSLPTFIERAITDVSQDFNFVIRIRPWSTPLQIGWPRAARCSPS
jgi:hypothetical protein